MYTKYQRGWIHGLPGYELPSGVPVEVVQFDPPKPVAGNWFASFISRLLRFLGAKQDPIAVEPRLSFAILAAADLIVSLGKLAANKTTIPRLILVIRTDASEEKDNEYQMGSATIESVLPVHDLTGISAVNVRCNSMAIRSGISMNPGPPTDAPEIHSKGINNGWVFLPGQENPERGIVMMVEDLIPPDYNGKLTVHLGKPSPVIQQLSKSHRTPKIIMVLPDRTRRQYVEFKLWDVQSIALEEGLKAVFESNFIECLNG